MNLNPCNIPQFSGNSHALKGFKVTTSYITLKKRKFFLVDALWHCFTVLCLFWKTYLMRVIWELLCS